MTQLRPSSCLLLGAHEARAGCDGFKSLRALAGGATLRGFAREIADPLSELVQVEGDDLDIQFAGLAA
jgi:hypothetical protein